MKAAQQGVALLGGLAILAGPVCGAAEQAAEPPERWDIRSSGFMVSGWGGPTDEATAAAFVAAGFNTVMSATAHLELCRAHGLKAILFDATPEFAAAHRGDEAIWGYYVWDEPKAEEFAIAGERLAAFQAADPTHPAYINLMAYMDLDEYFRAVDAWFLSYDYYQWWWGPERQFDRLAAHRAAALKAGVPLICWVEANADKRYEWGEAGAGYLPDNAAKLRQSVYTALAYGVKGIQWFTTGLAIGSDGKLTESGADIAAINRDLAVLGPVLVRLRSTGVWHTTPVPLGAEGLPAGGRVAAEAEGLVIGAFLDDADGTEYLMVVNASIERPAEASLSVREVPSGVDELDRTNGEWRVRATASPEGVARLGLTLAPGDGALLRLR